MKTICFLSHVLLVVLALGAFGQTAFGYVVNGDEVSYDSTPTAGAPYGNFQFFDPDDPLGVTNFPLDKPIKTGKIIRLLVTEVAVNHPVIVYTTSNDDVDSFDLPLGFETTSSSQAKPAIALTPQLTPGQTTSVPVSNNSDSFDVTPDGSYTVVVGYPNANSPVSLVDNTTESEIQTLNYPNQTSDAVAIGDDGQTVVVVTGTIGTYPNPTNLNTIRLLTLSNGTLTDTGQTLVLSGSAYIAKVLIAPGSQTGVALVINSGVGTSSQLISFTLPGLVETGSVSLARPSGCGLVINSAGTEVFARSGDDAAHPDVIEGFTYNSTTAALTGPAVLTITPISGFTGSLLQDPLAITLDGSQLVAVEQNVDGILSAPRMSTWDATTGALVSAFIGNPDPETICIGPNIFSTPVSFSAWEASYNFSGDASVASENDGVPNLLKYLYDIDPTQAMTVSDRTALPTLGTMTSGGTNYLTLTYRQYALETGITVNVQTSADLQTWTTVATEPSASIVQVNTDSITGDPIMQAQVPITGSKQFIRLNVTQP